MVSDKLYVLGDSIACGVMYSESQQGYTIFRDRFDRALKALGITVKNMAKPGCTSKGGLDILNACDAADGGVIAIEFGGNDSDLIWKEVAQTPSETHQALVPLNEYIRTMKQMIEKARALKMRPVVVTPLPVVAERYLKWISRSLNESAILDYLGSSQYIYRWQEQYAYAAASAAREANCPVFDLRGLFLGRRDFESLMSQDGIHPNACGHLLIRDSIVKAWKEKMLS